MNPDKNYKLPFGRYKGFTINEVFLCNPYYLEWLVIFIPKLKINFTEFTEIKKKQFQISKLEDFNHYINIVSTKCWEGVSNEEIKSFKFSNEIFEFSKFKKNEIINWLIPPKRYYNLDLVSDIFKEGKNKGHKIINIIQSLPSYFEWYILNSSAVCAIDLQNHTILSSNCYPVDRYAKDYFKSKEISLYLGIESTNNWSVDEIIEMNNYLLEAAEFEGKEEMFSNNWGSFEYNLFKDTIELNNYRKYQLEEQKKADAQRKISAEVDKINWENESFQTGYEGNSSNYWNTD